MASLCRQPPGRGHRGTSSPAGIKGLVCAPAALLLEFTRGGQTYTCLARLEGGAQ